MSRLALAIHMGESLEVIQAILFDPIPTLVRERMVETGHGWLCRCTGRSLARLHRTSSSGASRKRTTRTLCEKRLRPTDSSRCTLRPAARRSRSSRTLPTGATRATRCCWNPTPDGWLPLHYAVLRAPLGTIEFLANRCDERALLKATNDGDLPLHFAATRGELDVIIRVVDHGERALQHENASGELPLHCAACNESPDVVRFLARAYTQRPCGNKTTRGGVRCTWPRATAHRRMRSGRLRWPIPRPYCTNRAGGGVSAAPRRPAPRRGAGSCGMPCGDLGSAGLAPSHPQGW
jgi:Ankyrin repeats (3 copies)